MTLIEFIIPIVKLLAWIFLFIFGWSVVSVVIAVLFGKIVEWGQK